MFQFPDIIPQDIHAHRHVTVAFGRADIFMNLVKQVVHFLFRFKIRNQKYIINIPEIIYDMHFVRRKNIRHTPKQFLDLPFVILFPQRRRSVIGKINDRHDKIRPY